MATDDAPHCTRVFGSWLSLALAFAGCTSHPTAPNHGSHALAPAPSLTPTPPHVQPQAEPTPGVTAQLSVRTYKAFLARTPQDLDRPFEPDDSFRVQVSAESPELVVSSCRGLIALPLSKDIRVLPAKELVVQGFWSTAVDCLALSMLQSAQPARTSLLGDMGASADPSSVLPPELGMVDFDDEHERSRARAAAARCESWHTHDPGVRLGRADSEGWQVRTKYWTGTVTPYGRGDFDHDGYEDLLVVRIAKANGGSYAGTVLFLLTKTNADACLRVSLMVGRL